MPVAVIALAAGSFAAGVTAVAAATSVVGLVAAGATMVGAALTMVGTVTGNAKLTKIGAIVGIAGGIGTLATNMASGASAAATAGAESGVEAAAGGVADAAGSAAADVAADAAGTLPVAAPGGIEALGETAATAGNAASTGGGMLDAATSSTAANAVSGSTNDLLAQSLQDPTSAFNAGKTAAGQAAGNAFDAAGTTVGQSATVDAFKAPDLLHPASNSGGMLGAIESGSSAAGSPGFLSGVNAWAKANPELAKMALSGAGTAFGNLVPSSRDKAMMEAYKAQSAASAQQTADAKRKALWGAGRTV